MEGRGDAHRRGDGSSGTALLGLGITALAGAAGVAAWMATRERERHPHDDAPGRTARQRRFGDYAIAHRTVTIRRDPVEIYRFWRDFSNLASVMENVRSVTEDASGRLRWVIAGPAGRGLEIETRIVSDREGEEIAWASVEGAEIETRGKVAFREAPAGRGTEVTAIVAYKPPMGELGRFVATVLQKEPSIQARRELKRLKMLMETGEIATSRNRRHD